VRLAVVGAGAMGLPIAARLVALGHAVTVRDVDPEREALARAAGCTLAPTAARAADGADAVLVVVVDSAQLRAVLHATDGLLQAAAAPRAVLLCPTIGPADAEAAAAALAARGIDALDAPMSGGPARAADGTMSLMVGAPADVFARWRPLLGQLAARLFHAGPRAGDGARTKLVNNLLAAVNLAGAAEALALAERLGLDPAATLDVIEASSGQSWIGSDRLRRALAGDTRVLARTALLAKDSALALEAAAGAGFAAPLGRAAARRFAAAVRAGAGTLDDACLWQRARRRRRGP
jgi:putative dehydrogenase